MKKDKGTILSKVLTEAKARGYVAHIGVTESPKGTPTVGVWFTRTHSADNQALGQATLRETSMPVRIVISDSRVDAGAVEKLRNAMDRLDADIGKIPTTH